jgi:hypothetical protein
LDFTTFYLDDGVLGGTSRAVKLYCIILEKSLADVGLTLSQEKCEIVPAALNGNSIAYGTFNGFKFNAAGNFKLLGAPFGSTAFCSEHTRKRKQKAEQLLKEVAGLQDTQSAMHLLRQCVSFCKLAYSVRIVPPCMHREALQEFTTDVKAAVTEMLDAEVDDRAWGQAKLAIKRSGLGLRAAEDHAAAAFLASVSSVQNLCQSIDSAFDVEDSGGHLQVVNTRQQFRDSILPDAVVDIEGGRQRHKYLSSLIDAKLEKMEVAAAGRRCVPSYPCSPCTEQGLG